MEPAKLTLEDRGAAYPPLMLREICAMAGERRPVEVARRLGDRRDRHARSGTAKRTDAWCRETFTLPREDAREAARDWFARFPKAAYMTEIESWRVLDDGRIEFTMRRLPTAD